MSMHAIGARLNKTLAEVGAMTEEEFFGWIAFFEIQREEQGVV